jgi:hypothetical protein
MTQGTPRSSRLKWLLSAVARKVAMHATASMAVREKIMGVRREAREWLGNGWQCCVLLRVALLLIGHVKIAMKSLWTSPKLSLSLAHSQMLSSALPHLSLLCLFLLNLLLLPLSTHSCSPAATITVGQNTTLCLLLSPLQSFNTTLTYSRYTFQPVVSQYDLVALRFRGSFSGAYNATASSSYAVRLGNATSFMFTYTTPSSVFTKSTLIASVDNGIVTSLVQDSDCAFCSDSSESCEWFSYDFLGNPRGDEGATRGCYTNDVTTCAESADGGGNYCDLNVYIVFQGSDTNGVTLFSSDGRSSMFKGFGLGEPNFEAWNLN